MMFESFNKEWKKIEMEYYSMTMDVLLDKTINHLDTKIVIFGVGELGYAYAKKLSDGNLISKLVAFCDNDKSGYCEIYNVPIISLKELVNNPYFSDTFIVVAVMPAYAPTPTYTPAYSDEIYYQCVNLGIQSWRILRCFSNLELDIFKLGSIDVFKKDFFEGYKLAYEFTKKQETKHMILERIKSYLFYFQKTDSQFLENYQEQIGKMKYRSCRYVEYFYLRFGGNINGKIVKFCCAHLEDMSDVPAVYLGKAPEETLNSIFELRSKIIAENIAFSLLGEEATEYDRNLTAGCAKCNMYYLNNWNKPHQDIISNINLGMYPAPCQSRCLYCDVPNSDLSRFEMRIHGKAIQDILDTIKYMQTKELISLNTSYRVVTGEITIHPLKSKIIEAVKNNSIQFGTNAFIFDKEIVRNPQFGLYFSIDAGTPETWKKVKGIDNFEDVLNNLCKYAAVCKNAEKIVLKYVLLPGINDNILDYEGVIKIMNFLKINTLIISANYNNMQNIKMKEREKLIVAAGYLYAFLEKNNMNAIISALSYSSVENEKIIDLSQNLRHKKTI